MTIVAHCLQRGVVALALLAAPAAAYAQETDPGRVRADGRVIDLPTPQEIETRGRPTAVPNFRQNLRESINILSDYAKGRSPSFLMVTREGLGLLIHSAWEAKLQDLATEGKEEDAHRNVQRAGTLKRLYVRSLDAVILDGQYCGKPKTASEGFMKLLKEAGLVVLSIDHCGSPAATAKAYRAARRDGVVPHVDTGSGPLKRVPATPPFGENPDNVFSLAQAKNALVLDGNAGYATKHEWLMALADTNHDVLVIDAFHRDRTPLTAREVYDLKFKRLGARRLVLARLNVTWAMDTRYYWKDTWRPGNPSWLGEPVPERPGAYRVDYWHPDWQALIGRTFAGLMDLGFDGIVLEGLEAYQTYEARIELE